MVTAASELNPNRSMDGARNLGRLGELEIGVLVVARVGQVLADDGQLEPVVCRKISARALTRVGARC
jgi:hypothetical protein